jgi:hypothetical protein
MLAAAQLNDIKKLNVPLQLVYRYLLTFEQIEQSREDLNRSNILSPLLNKDAKKGTTE